MDNALVEGDRIKRRADLQDRQSWRYGVIDKVYLGMPDGKGNRETLYAVKWDDTGVVERGYLRVSLVKVLPPVALPTAQFPT